MIAVVQRYALAGLLSLLLASSGAAWLGWSRAAGLRGQRDAAQALAASYAEAARVLSAHVAEVEAQRQALQSDLARTSNLEGADAALSPYARAVLGRLLRR